MNYKIGYIDEDLEQVKKFTRILKEHELDIIGYDIRQGMLIDELIEQIYTSDIDLLMIDYLLNGTGILTFNGDEVARLYSEIKPSFPYIIFTSHEEDAFNHTDNPNIIYEKEMATDGNKVGRFVEVIKKNIETYQSYIQTRKSTIETLINKGEGIGLNGYEEDQLLTAQMELNSLDTRTKKEVPLQLMSNEKLDDISKTRKEAQAFLQSLIENNKT